MPDTKLLKKKSKRIKADVQKKERTVKPTGPTSLTKIVKKPVFKKAKVKKPNGLKIVKIKHTSDLAKAFKQTEIGEKKTKPMELVQTRPAEKSPRAKRGTGAIMYFTKETEDAIVLYNETFDQRLKNQIYNEKIKYAFSKIAENIFNTFKFSYNEVSPIKVQEEAISHMVANIDKYEKGKGKAFSYFSIVAKHWFILENNNNYRRFKKHSTIAEQPDDTGEFVVEPEYYSRVNETREFIQLMIKFWDVNMRKHFSKQRDIEIANAVVEIFRNSDRIDIFNKKALYLYIREIADCQTQHITKVVNKMKGAQKIIFEEYSSSGTIEIDEQNS
jgi:hypothetical protein